jgi:predicted secreted protein
VKARIPMSVSQYLPVEPVDGLTELLIDAMPDWLANK